MRKSVKQSVGKTKSELRMNSQEEEEINVICAIKTRVCYLNHGSVYEGISEAGRGGGRKGTKAKLRGRGRRRT